MLFIPEKLVDRINKELIAEKFGTNPAELYEPIRYFMQIGGKRLRPLLTLYGTWIFSDEVEAAVKPALGIEIFHNFTLMHDDIMDNAPLRRNKQTVHKKWDNNVAILAGDVMLIKAYNFLLSIDKELYPEILRSFNTCAAEVCEGQQMDVNFEHTSKVTEEEYLEMIRLKTAVLLGYSLELGARIGGADEKNAGLLKKAGESLGIAFQLKDDLLDVYGDQKKFGKQVGGDIVANKKTFLLIKALEKAKGDELKGLNACLSSTKMLPEEKVEKVKAIYDKLAIQAETERKIEYYIEKGLFELQQVDCSLYRKGHLKKYFLKLADREN